MKDENHYSSSPRAIILRKTRKVILGRTFLLISDNDENKELIT